MESGSIVIGREDNKICKTPAEVIQVRVLGGTPHSKTTYNFQELQDLVSRIVLITGKSNTDDQTGMHKFLEVNMIVAHFVSL